MHGTQRFDIPRLATVTIDTDHVNEPLLEIVLDPAYRGDLNDLEKDNELPSGVYLRCDSTSCIDDPRLAKFMETLHHWDHDFDGTFDGDHVADAIEDALWRSREAPDEFHRPKNGVYTRALMAFMPPQPQRHIVFGFGQLKDRFRWYHYAWGLPALVLILALVNAQIYYVPWTKYSVITGAMAGAEAIGVNPMIVLGLLIGILIARRNRRANDPARPIAHSQHTYGFFNKAAVFEEQAFREGAENWNWAQRLMSCIVFGAIHMVNLIYPLATILPLALGGALFMAVYLRVYKRTRFRRSAVLAASVVHRVYNRIALAAFAISIVLLFGTWAVGILAVFAVLVATVGRLDFVVNNDRERKTVYSLAK